MCIRDSRSTKQMKNAEPPNKLTMRPLRFLLAVLLLVVSLWLVFRLVDLTYAKEGFAASATDDAVEDPLTPQQFSFHLLQGVMGPIRRLSKELVNLDNWKERWELAQLSPTDLARRHFIKARGQDLTKRAQ